MFDLTPNQSRSFWASWGGWAMDGMDSFIYALVLAPAMRELLPKSGIAPTAANVGSYGAILFALFMVGWGVALLWGPIADRFGRARTLMFTILWFSVFTLLAAFAQSIWSLAFYRFMAGFGIGGEWAVGAALVNEALPENRRVIGGGFMHTGYYFGFFVAAMANYFVGSRFGWRPMFFVGGLPALVVAYLYNRVHEPPRWQEKSAEARQAMHKAFLEIFSPRYLRNTILNSTYVLASIAGLWAGSAYVPTAITELARNAGRAAEAAKLASWSGAILAIGTIIGAAISPFLAEWLGRKTTLALFFALMLAFIVLSFGYVFYLGPNALEWFLVCTFFSAKVLHARREEGRPRMEGEIVLVSRVAVRVVPADDEAEECVRQCSYFQLVTHLVEKGRNSSVDYEILVYHRDKHVDCYNTARNRGLRDRFLQMRSGQAAVWTRIS